MAVCRFAQWLGQHGLLRYGTAAARQKKPSEKTLRYFQRYGTWSLLLAWLPIVGDALPLAAGWLRLNWKICALMLITGKMLHYGLIGWGVMSWA